MLFLNTQFQKTELFFHEKMELFFDEKVIIRLDFNFIAESYLMAENYMILLLFNQPSHSHWYSISNILNKVNKYKSRSIESIYIFGSQILLPLP